MTASTPALQQPLRATPSPGRALRPLALAAGLLLAGAGALAQTAAAAAQPASAAASGPTIRAEVAKPLQAAQDAIKAGNHKDALARLAEAEAMPGLTPYEVFITQRLKGPAAFGAGDLATATQVFEQVLASPLLAAADRAPITESTVKMLLQLKDYPRAAALMRRYLDAGGSSLGAHDSCRGGQAAAGRTGGDQNRQPQGRAGAPGRGRGDARPDALRGVHHPAPEGPGGLWRR